MYIKKNKIQNYMTPSRMIALSFFLVIMVGSVLLYAPFSRYSGVDLDYLDALFVAVSATCVTGLTPVVISETFNTFGQMVLLCLIQIGGVGLVTCIAYLTIVFTKKLPIKDKHVVRDMLNYETLGQFKQFVLKIIKYIMVIEGVGAILLAVILFDEYGLYSLFHGVFLSVSAFCNAGFDLFGSNSLQSFQSNYWLQIVVMLLIILGSLGFTVWADGVHVLKSVCQMKSCKNINKYMTLHTKIVLKVTLLLIVVPAVFIFSFESSVAHFMFLDRIFASVFQSVTLRTAGFYTIDFSVLKLSTLLLMLPVMFVGGSSGGTAGGIKTTTIYLIYKHMKMIVTGKKRVILYHKEIKKETVQKSFVLATVNLIILFLSVLLLSTQIDDVGQLIAYLFESTSALATVGISMGITVHLSVMSKVIIMLLMFIGRIGILTVLLSLNKKNIDNMNIKYPSGKILVG